MPFKWSRPRGRPLLPDDDMFAAHREPSVSLPVVGVVEAARARVLDHEPLDSATPVPLNREDPHHTVALEDAKHDHLAGDAPAAFPVTVAAKHRLVALDSPGERLGTFLGDTDS